MSQYDAILKHLRAGNKITTLDATFKFGCTQLAARFCKMKKNGIHIANRWIKLPSGKRVKEYWLPKPQQRRLFDV